LRALELIYFSAFLALLFQIEGLIGPRGILPARSYPLRLDAPVRTRQADGKIVVTEWPQDLPPHD
jgi:hypothetical protein